MNILNKISNYFKQWKNKKAHWIVGEFQTIIGAPTDEYGRITELLTCKSYSCSICGTYGQLEDNYCRHCGAKIEKSEEEENLSKTKLNNYTYDWHDLKKNKNDLPLKQCIVKLKQYPFYAIGELTDKNFWEIGTIDLCITLEKGANDIIAWKYIEPFET